MGLDRWIVLSFLLIVLTIGGPSDAKLQESRSPKVEAAIEEGASLERSRRWIEAIESYEKATKAHPDTHELEYGLRRSKIHLSIERRYSENSFTSTMLALSRREALGLIDDVMARVESSFVDTISATAFVAHGTECLHLALANQKFVEHHLDGVSNDQIQAFRRMLRKDYWNKPVFMRAGARETVGQVADLAREQLGLTDAAVIMEYLFGGCNALDDYSGCLTPGRLKDLNNNIEGHFVGLGIEMKAEYGKGLLLVNVLPNSPAEEGGLLTGEYVVGIDGTDCTNLSIDEASTLLQGREGTIVSLDIKGRGEAKRKGVFRRRAVDVKSIPIARMIDRNEGIGYIQVTGFQVGSAEEFDAALEKLKGEGMRALVLDVRGNPGGLLNAAVDILERVINEGVLVSTRGRNENLVYRAHGRAIWRGPLVLVTDGDSASASEIVAGAVRDHRRGQIVGRQTFGKWSVQGIYRVRGIAGLRLTISKFYSPNGENYAKIGVKPDILVDEPSKTRTYYRAATDLNLEEDTDLQKGMEILRKQLAKR